MKNISLSTFINRSPRVLQLEGIFDLTPSSEIITNISLNIPNLDESNWNVGLIVGPSGAGKSTVALELFGDNIKNNEQLSWSKK